MAHARLAADLAAVVRGVGRHPRRSPQQPSTLSASPSIDLSDILLLSYQRQGQRIAGSRTLLDEMPRRNLVSGAYLRHGAPADAFPMYVLRYASRRMRASAFKFGVHKVESVGCALY